MTIKTQSATAVSSGGVVMDTYSIQENGELYKPETLVLSRGPYNIHMAYIDTPTRFSVQKIIVKQQRPAIMQPDFFANLRAAKMNNINTVEELRRI